MKLNFGEMKFFVFFMLVFALGCAKQMYYSHEETGRVASYFHMPEEEVKKIYIESAYDWDKAIEKIILSQMPVITEEKEKIPQEIEKIKLECNLR